MPTLTRSHDSQICLIVDSTGLKILGCGEWNTHKHKASKKRRDWRKLHIGVDEEGFIVAAELTASSGDDASTLPDLLDQIEVPIRRFTADGAYDHRSIYDQVSAAGSEDVVIVIPPRRSAVSAEPTAGPWAQREAAIERIREVGRREWQKESGYRQQARVENGFFRYKSMLGGGLKARHSKAQSREAAIGCHILNRMAALGRPKSYALVLSTRGGNTAPLVPELNRATAPVLRRMLNVAVRKKLLPANPCLGVEFPVKVQGLFGRTTCPGPNNRELNFKRPSICKTLFGSSRRPDSAYTRSCCR